MNPMWLLLIVPASIAVGVFGAYYANTYRGEEVVAAPSPVPAPVPIPIPAPVPPAPIEVPGPVPVPIPANALVTEDSSSTIDREG